ncbi:MAG: hypothetical protein GXY44_04850 [Phycisphaerales bacterium]|nr:hypothetical protein [Phycisphaerales bacterium]
MSKYLFVGIAAILAATSMASAEIIDWDCFDDDDGAIVMDTGASVWTQLGDTGGIPTYQLDMFGTQNWAPAHVEGWFETDTEEDPIVWLVQTVDNQTTFAWTHYEIIIGMPQAFSIIGVVAPPDWTWAITAPVSGQPIPNGGTGWLGSVDYYAGTPIPVGGSGTFGVILQFDGSVQFCTEQIPTPEPVTAGLLALGGLVFLRRRA